MATLQALLWIALAIAIVGACLVARAEVIDDRPGPCTREDARCAEVERRLALARDAMHARGIRRLLIDRPAWQRLTPDQPGPRRW